MLFQGSYKPNPWQNGYSVLSLIRMLFTTVFVLVLVVAAFAQTERGTIRGTVQDPSGAVMAGVKVTAVNVATGVPSEATSTVDGFYSISELPAGTYKVTAELKGFKQLIENNVVVAVAAVVGLDLKMEVGTTTQTITVTAASDCGSDRKYGTRAQSRCESVYGSSTYGGRATQSGKLFSSQRGR